MNHHLRFDQLLGLGPISAFAVFATVSCSSPAPVSPVAMVPEKKVTFEVQIHEVSRQRYLRTPAVETLSDAETDSFFASFDKTPVFSALVGIDPGETITVTDQKDVRSFVDGSLPKMAMRTKSSDFGASEIGTRLKISMKLQDQGALDSVFEFKRKDLEDENSPEFKVGGLWFAGGFPPSEIFNHAMVFRTDFVNSGNDHSQNQVPKFGRFVVSVRAAYPGNEKYLRSR